MTSNELDKGWGEFNWKLIFEETPDYLLIVDERGRIKFINKVGPATTIEEAVSHSIYDYMAVEFHKECAEKLGRVFAKGCQEQLETRRSDPEASEQWWSMSMAPVRDENNAVIAALLICRDVTDLQNIRREQRNALEQVQAKFWKELSAHDRSRELLIEEINVRRMTEESLRESEGRYRSLIDNAHNAIFSIDHDGTFLFLNPVAAQILGGTPTDFVGKPMTDFFPPEIAKRQLAAVAKVITTKEGEFRQTQTFIQGRLRWYKTSIQPIVNSNGHCTAALLESTDIDDNVRTTQQLQRERNFSNSILQTANSLIVCLDSQARITVFNGECETVTGYKFEEVVGRSWPEVFLPPEIRHDGLKNFDQWVRQHPHDRYEGPIVAKSGEIRTIFWSNSSFVFEDTGELMAIAIGADITELKRLERSLSETEARNRAILEALPDMVFLIDQDGVYRAFQGGYRQKLLIPEDLIVGSRISDALPTQFAEKALSLTREAIRTGVMQQWEYTIQSKKLNGTFEARFVRCDENECTVFVRDVTERKRIEQKLQEALDKGRIEHQKLLDTNIALKVLLSQNGQDSDQVRAQVRANIEKLALPIIRRLRNAVSGESRNDLELLETTLKELESSFSRTLQMESANLTPREIEICNLIKEEYRSKEMARKLSLSVRTIEKFRQRIRQKLGIKHKGSNLTSFLKKMSGNT